MTDSGQPSMETLFNHLDRWRHFAGFPLETRVDALIGLFLPKVVEDRCGVEEMNPEVIPQFPLKKSDSNQSTKADFLALSRDGGRVFLIELKTDMGSRNNEQYRYLCEARKRGMTRILSEFNEVAGGRNVRKNDRLKYFHVISALSQMGLLRLSKELEEKIRSGDTGGAAKLIGEIKIGHSTDSKIEVIFVQPRKADPP